MYWGFGAPDFAISSILGAQESAFSRGKETRDVHPLAAHGKWPRGPEKVTSLHTSDFAVSKKTISFSQNPVSDHKEGWATSRGIFAPKSS